MTVVPLVVRRYNITPTPLRGKRAKGSVSYKYRYEMKLGSPSSEGGDDKSDLDELDHGCFWRAMCQEPLA